MNEHLPASIRLPFGYVITVKAVSKRMMASLSPGEPVMGLWVDSSRTIYIDRTLGVKEQRYVLTHEFIRAFADWQHFALDGGTGN